jgi:hypothetical protein
LEAKDTLVNASTRQQYDFEFAHLGKHLGGKHDLQDDWITFLLGPICPHVI